MLDAESREKDGDTNNGQLAGKWTSYAAVAVAASVGGAQTAEGEIVYRDIDDVTVLASGPLVATSTGTSSPSYSASAMEQVALAADPFDLNFAHRIFGLSASSSGAYFQSQIEVLANQGFGGVVRGETTRLVSRLETGEDIAAAARELGISFRAGNGDMLNSDDVENFTAEERDQSFRNREGFVGFQFEDAANNEQLGWVRVVGGVETNGYTVLDYAFTTSGEPLFAGQTTAVAIPEPAGLGMLAFGAVGLVALRRREREQQ